MITKQNKKVTKSTLISFLNLPDIWRRHRWFAREMTSEKRAQKFHTGDWLEICLIQSDVGSDASSVWNFCARFSNVISRETTGSVAKCRLFSQATWVSNTNGLEVQLTVHAVTVDRENWASWLFKTYSAMCGSSIYAMMQLLRVRAFRSLT